jgi:hypothetical protein
MKKKTLSIVSFILVVVESLMLLGCEEMEAKDILTDQEYVVFAWNDLGMHCLNPTYDSAVILPPYNTIWATVVKRGEPPSRVVDGVIVTYSLKDNTSSSDKAAYGGFWDNATALFGLSLAPDTGLNLKVPEQHNSLSGEMMLFDDHFEAVGIPVVPVDDSGQWNPYQVAIITVKDMSGNVLAETEATVPTSDEINCAKCHGSTPFDDIIAHHDEDNGTELVTMKPFLCAKCHGSPALGQTGQGDAGLYLSLAVHGFHSDKGAQCYDCHPGNQTQCSRSSAHTAKDGNCITCHGDMTAVAESIKNETRIPWVKEPACFSCHNDVLQVETGSSLYRNAKGHGDLYCPVCHGSPHAMVPSQQPSDNYQAKQYQSVSLPLGSCRVCHKKSKGGGNDFGEKHEGISPAHVTACNICHTAAHDDKANWPHQFSF